MSNEYARRGKQYRSSHWRCSMINSIFKNSVIFTGSHLFWSLFLIKLKAFRSAKKRHQHLCFPVNILKFLKTPILKNICEKLLLMQLVSKLCYDSGKSRFSLNYLKRSSSLPFIQDCIVISIPEVFRNVSKTLPNIYHL